MKSHILYGLPDQPLEEYAQWLNSVLGINFDAHDSSYTGSYYISGSFGGEEFVLQRNQLPDEDWMEEKYQEYPILLYINKTVRSVEVDRLLVTKMASIQKLRQDDVG